MNYYGRTLVRIQEATDLVKGSGIANPWLVSEKEHLYIGLDTIQYKGVHIPLTKMEQNDLYKIAYDRYLNKKKNHDASILEEL